MDLMILGETLRYIRINITNISQEDLADKVGLERTYISKIESGKKNITLETLSSICDGLGLSISNFFIKYDKQLKESYLGKEYKNVKTRDKI